MLRNPMVDNITETVSTTRTGKEDTLVTKMYSDLKYSHSKMCGLHAKMKDDVRFAQGDQWDSNDVSVLASRGVKAITVNKVKPIIKLLIGIERQSKSDYKILPEGDEDSIAAEIASRLVKNVVKNSRLADKLSETFKAGITSGMSFLEPYIDYTFDLLNGDLKFKKVSGRDIYLDPDFEEYDLSDSRYMFKVSAGLEKGDILALFPDEEKKINNISDSTIDIDLEFGSDAVSSDKYTNYETGRDNEVKGNDRADEVQLYDLIDYYYKDFQKRYYVFFPEKEEIKEFSVKKQAEAFAVQYQNMNPQVLERKVNVIMLMQVVGSTILFNDLAPTYPRWKTYPIIPYFAELASDDLDNMALKIQGIVRGIKDLNVEYNKRRTQELNILNSSQNSGFWIEQGALTKDELAHLKTHGSSPGFVGIHKRGSAVPTRIQPMALSQGHAQLAVENAQDLKEASSVNPDLLANDSKSQSGRAKLLQQRQGLTMAQEMLDNYAITRAQLGRYIISQLSEIMTVKSAMRILGSAFIAENFKTPVNVILERALVKTQQGAELTDLEKDTMLQYSDVPPDQPIMNEDGSLVTVTDTDTAEQVVELVLTNTELGKYDVAVSDGVFAETIASANFLDLKELAQQGVPIPPQLLIESSMLPDADKQKAIQMLAAQAQAQASQIKQ